MILTFGGGVIAGDESEDPVGLGAWVAVGVEETVGVMECEVIAEREGMRNFWSSGIVEDSAAEDGGLLTSMWAGAEDLVVLGGPDTGVFFFLGAMVVEYVSKAVNQRQLEGGWMRWPWSPGSDREESKTAQKPYKSFSMTCNL